LHQAYQVLYLQHQVTNKVAQDQLVAAAEVVEGYKHYNIHRQLQNFLDSVQYEIYCS
jgi:hypothetical protein